METTDPTVASDLRREIRSYLERHSDGLRSVDEAELVASELIQNALLHTQGPAWVSLRWTGMYPELTVSDLGPGFELDASLPQDRLAVGGRGLFIVSKLARQLEARTRATGGSVVSATLDVTRPRAVSRPAVRRRGSLPELHEAQPEGGFGREAFLRALAVQLASTMELQHGPAAAEAAVAQVGADVGGQMEDEFRRAHDVVGRMSAAQIAECFVRLKAAIGGGFSVHEVADDRIVLINDRCPFGESVRRAPALCWMTSSVFGGIASHNTGSGALVVLEERIAVGDPQCRVVVWLDVDAPSGQHTGHRYEPV